MRRIFILKRTEAMLEYSLVGCPLFAGMTPAQVEELVVRCVSDVKEFVKGEHVVRQGGVINHLYLLVSGLVRTEMITKDDNVLEIEFIDPVRPLAPAFVFADRNFFPVDVIAMEEKTVLYLIPKSVFQKEMMQNETLLRNFLRINSNIIVFLSGKVQMLSIRSLRMKLAIYLLENTTEKQNTFKWRRTHAQLAEYFGVQRPSLSRTLGEMVADGVIALDKQEVTVLDRRKLQSYM